MSHILIVSSANMDFVMPLSVFPASGQTVIDRGAYRYVPGGKGANSAVAFRRLGADCTFCAKLGQDENGNALEKVYKEEGIDTSRLVRSETAPTGLAAILVEQDGSNRIIVYPGANADLTRDDIDRAMDCRPDALYLQLEITADAVLYAASRAAERHIPIFLDAGPADAAFPLEKLPPLVVFSPNETETAIFTGISPDNLADCERCARALLTRVKAEYIVLKLGSRGAYVFDGETGTVYPSFPAQAVDTTAAGDAFTAALVLKYLETNDMALSVPYANAVGAITVSRPGASSSIPTEEETLAFLSRHPLNA